MTHNFQDMNTKCTTTRTLEQPHSEILLNSRLAVMIGVGLAFMLVFIVVVVACCSRLCAKKPQEPKVESPDQTDSSFYKHFTAAPGGEGTSKNV